MLELGTNTAGTTLFLSGSLQPDEAQDVRVQLESKINQLSGTQLTVDCAGLRAVSFLLVSLLLRACAHARHAGKQLILSEVPDDLQAVIAACGLSSLLLEGA